MEAYYDLIKRLIKAFETFGVGYVFTGALAASYYGLPRTTTDVDVIVQIAEESTQDRLVHALKCAGMKVDEKEVDRALVSGYKIARFSDGRTAYTVDVILSNEKPQRRSGTIAGIQTFFQTPEDLILAKLRMIKATVPKERALKDKDDIRAILRFTAVDVEAIKKRAKRETTLSTFEALTAC